VFVDGLVVRIPIGEVRSSASHCASYYSIVPFVVGMGCEFFSIKGINGLGNEVLTHEDNSKNDDKLVDGLADDVFQHGF